MRRKIVLAPAWAAAVAASPVAAFAHAGHDQGGKGEKGQDIKSQAGRSRVAASAACSLNPGRPWGHARRAARKNSAIERIA